MNFTEQTETWKARLEDGFLSLGDHFFSLSMKNYLRVVAVYAVWTLIVSKVF